MSNIVMIMESLKELSSESLWKIHDQCATELKKRGKEPKQSKPPIQQKPTITWPRWVLDHALKNGWIPFPKISKKPDLITGEMMTEEVKMPESIFYNSCFVYKGSEKNKKTPGGKKMTLADATILSKYYWAPKAKEGHCRELYEEYMRSSELPEVSDESEEEPSDVQEDLIENPVVKVENPVVKVEKPVVKIEKPVENPVVKVEKPVEKVENPVVKVVNPVVKVENPVENPVEKPTDSEKAEKRAKKAEKEAKRAKKAEKEAKRAKKAEKEAKRAEKPGEWTCKDDGMAHEFPLKGKMYLRNFKGSVWHTDGKDEYGLWKAGDHVGKWDNEKHIIDDTVSEPEETEEE